VSNILLITGLAVVFNKKNISLNSNYLYIDLHFLLGSFLFFYMIAYDGTIYLLEAAIGIVIFIIYSVYLIKGEALGHITSNAPAAHFPAKAAIILLAASVGIFFWRRLYHPLAGNHGGFDGHTQIDRGANAAFAGHYLARTGREYCCH
jgi:cation:H+ antiporter